MSSSLSFHFPKALPPLSTTTQRRSVSLSLLSQQKQSHNSKKIASFSLKATDCLSTLNKKSSLGIQVATILTTVAPVTGVNNEEDFTWVLIQLGISAIFYFLVVPVSNQFIYFYLYVLFGRGEKLMLLNVRDLRVGLLQPFIMNWLRKRWYRRNLLEMYLQFMFYPG